jgi:ribulose-5-phosphate 4-epimerase/fuculose-1-phosphate aldolase
VHAARPDVIAAAHSHSVYGRSWSALGRKLDPITQDACAFYDDHALFADYTGVVLQTSEGDRIAEGLGKSKAVILQNHGLLTVGHSVDAAAFWFISMDKCCQSQLLAEAAGKPLLIRPEEAALTHMQVGSEGAGWLSFQPLYARIVKEEPNLLE